jgi:hypothetical protein
MMARRRGGEALSTGSFTTTRAYGKPPFESDEHYEERREAFNQGYGIIDPTPVSIWRSPL